LRTLRGVSPEDALKLRRRAARSMKAFTEVKASSSVSLLIGEEYRKGSSSASIFSKKADFPS
jgi:hypothetical protein